MVKRSPVMELIKFHIENKKWLEYSFQIAYRVMIAMDQKGNMTQKQLAEKVGVSPQYISKVVSGNENLSLETIAKLSDALGVELISFPAFKDVKFGVKKKNKTNTKAKAKSKSKTRSKKKARKAVPKKS